MLKGIRHLIMTKFVCALAAVSLTATATSQTKPSGQRSLADDVVLQFVSVGVDPVPVLGALAGMRQANCAAGVVLSSSLGALGEVLAVAGSEAISQPFRFVVALKFEQTVDPAAILGSKAQLRITVGGVGTTVQGVVTEARSGTTPEGKGTLVIALEPTVALLARGSGFSVHRAQRAGFGFGTPCTGRSDGRAPAYVRL